MLAALLALVIPLPAQAPGQIFSLDIPLSTQPTFRRMFRAPDLDGDGVDDFTIVDRERLRTFSAATQAQIAEIPFLGGIEHIWIGDSNGDGHPDLLKVVSTNPHRLALVDGTTGTTLFDMTPMAIVSPTFYEPEPWFGPLPDVDGDGEEDFWVRARPTQSSTNYRLDFYSCVDGSFIRSVSRSVSTQFALSVRIYDDITGDGIEEIAVGANHPTSASGGRIWLINPITGNTHGDFIGSALQSDLGPYFEVIGDVDRDGVRDFLTLNINSPDNEGFVVMSGATGATLYLRRTPVLAGEGVSILGETASDLGDVDGDGHDDFLVGDRLREAVLAYSGATGTEIWRRVGAVGSGLGATPMGLGDINGDGKPNWIVGLPNSDVPGQRMFRVEGYEREFTGDEIEFEVAGDGVTPIVNGQAVDQNNVLAPAIRVSSTGAGSSGVSAFDTSPSGPNSTGAAPDLLVDVGNALILQGDAAQSVPGIFDTPTPAVQGGEILIEILDPARPLSLDLINVWLGSSAEVVVRDANGRSRTFSVAGGFTARGSALPQYGCRTLHLNTIDPQMGFVAGATAQEEAGFDQTRVASILIRLTGPSALDRIVLAEFGTPNPGALEELPAPGLSGRVINSTGLDDIDGDGVRDVVVAYESIPTAPPTIRIFSGATLTLLHSIPGIRGEEMVNVADMNSDGVGDLAIAWDGFSSASDTSIGVCYFYDAVTGLQLGRIQGAAAGAQFGSALVRLDDLDGDGLDDLAIGEQGPSSARGMVHLYSLAGLTVIRTIQGIPNTHHGERLARTGDQDGDGLDEIASGYDYSAGTGVAIWSTGTGLRLTNRSFSDLCFPDLGPFRFRDFDMDGTEDVLVASSLAGCPARVVSGATGLVLAELPGHTHKAQTFGVEDIDGDRHPDILQFVEYSVLRTVMFGFSGASFEPLFAEQFESNFSRIIRGTSMGDLDGDGRNEFAVIPVLDPPFLLYRGFAPLLWTVCLAEPHSGGLGARLRSVGSSSIAANDLALEVWNLPASSFVLLMNAQATIPVTGPGSLNIASDGNLCLSPSTLARHPVLFTVNGGMATMPLDLAALPTAGAPGFIAMATAGETRFWQCWFRDNSGTLGSNLSDAVAVTFTQ